MRKERALSLAEYTILLGIISTTFFGMQVCIKRHFQARIKLAADYFICNGQQPQQYTSLSASSQTVNYTESKDPTVIRTNESNGYVTTRTQGTTKRDGTSYSVSEGWEDLLPVIK